MAHDYTTETPFDENPDDFLIGNVAGPEKTPEEIEKENSFTPPPPGEQELVIVGFIGAPKAAYHKVFINGQPTGFEAFSVGVKLAVPGYEKRTVTDFFTLPPDDKASQHAYFHGVVADRQNDKQPSRLSAGFDANRFTHFINRIGFAWLPNTPFPDDAKRLGNWKGRKVVATITAGVGTYTDKNGNERQRDSRIKPFSYKVTGSPVAQTGPGNGRQAPARQPVGAGAAGANGYHDSGLDNI